MVDIFQLRIHGRGGQGAKTAGQIIAESALLEGKNVQAFPEYGPERAGAPMKSYVRISDEKIKTYAPAIILDAVMVIDPTLLESVNVTEGLKEDGMLIVNTNDDTTKVKEISGFPGKIVVLDANKLSIEYLGRPIPNTPCIGAFVKASGKLSVDSVKKVTEEHFLSKIGKEKTNKNLELVQRAYDEAKSS